jgi:hypothetical protein
LGNPINDTDPSGMWACRGNENCKAWVENALNMLDVAGETGHRIVSFFKQYDDQAKANQIAAYEAVEHSTLYGPGANDCSSNSPGVTISFEDVSYWGFSGFSDLMILSNDPSIIPGPMPTKFGAAIFGHEISHWDQGIERFSLQGEVLARDVERQLQLDLGGPEVPETVLVSRVNPFSTGGLRQARQILNFGTYRYLPLVIIGLSEDWLRNLAVPIPVAWDNGTPEPPQPTPGPQPVPPPAGTPGPR